MTNDDLIRLYKYYSDMAYTYLTMGYTEDSLDNTRRVIREMLNVLILLQIRYSLNEPDETLIKEAQYTLTLFDRIDKIDQSLMGK